MNKVSPSRNLILVLILMLVPFSHAFAQEQNRQTLDVVAYNVHLLPKVAAKFAGKRSDSAYRARAIADKLYAYGMLGISEAFDQDCSRSLVRRLQHKSENAFTIVEGPGRTGRHLIGSGLLFASKYPVVETHSMTYSDASRFVDSGFKADGFAAKGALHVRVRVGNSSDTLIDCFLTHLESRSREARDKQIVQFSKFVSNHSQQHIPAILLGDFNIEAAPSDSGSQYQRLMKSLHDSDQSLVDAGHKVTEGPKGTSDAKAESGGRRIDYIFFSENRSSGKIHLELLQTQHLRLLDKNIEQGSLSDHLAVKSVLLARSRNAQVSNLQTTGRVK